MALQGINLPLAPTGRWLALAAPRWLAAEHLWLCCLEQVVLVAGERPARRITLPAIHAAAAAAAVGC